VTPAPYVLTPAAEADLADAAAWLGRHDDAAAGRFLDDAYRTLALIGRRPRIGHPRRDLTARDVLFWPLRRRYLVIYAATVPPRILRVISGWRDVAELLRGEADMDPP